MNWHFFSTIIIYNKQKSKRMKALTQFMLSFCILLSVNLAQAQDTLSTQFEVKSIKFVENEGERLIAVSIKNKGDFFNYPIIQVKVGDKFIANEEARYDTYGIIDVDTYVFSCDIEITKKTILTILVTDGAFGNEHKLEFEYEPK